MKDLNFCNIAIRPHMLNNSLAISLDDIVRCLYQIQGSDTSVTSFKNAKRATIRLFTAHADEFTSSMTQIVKLKTNGGMQETRIFSLRGCHLLAMFARTNVAKTFRKWVLDILDELAATEVEKKVKRKVTVQLELPIDASHIRRDVIRQIDKLRDEARRGFSACQTIMQLCHPGCMPQRSAPLSEQEDYDTMMELYHMARENMAAAYNAIVLGYRIARQYGRA